MKLSFFTIVFLAMTTLHGQSTTLYDLQFNGPMSLETCLNKLKHKYDIEFAYPSTLAGLTIDPQPLRSTVNLDAYLKQIFLPQNIEFQSLANNQILLRSRDIDATLPEKERKISGRLMDSYSGEGIVYALVTFNEHEAYAYTDEDGFFNLEIPQNKKGQLKFHSLGYLDQEMALADWNNNSTLKLKLNENYFSEVTVLSPKPAMVLSSRDFSITMNQSSNIALGGIFNADPLRRLQLLSGVNALDDFSSEVKIRGSSGDATLITVDEIPIYKAEHFYGIFSSINDDYIDEINLYKNNLPIQYGGRMGGMVKMESQPELRTLNGNIRLNLLESKAALDIPLGKYLGIALGGRLSYLGLTQNSLMDLSGQNSDAGFLENGIARKTVLNNEPLFNFWDGNGKIYFQDKGQRFSFNFFQSLDDFENSYENKYATNRFVDVPNVSESFSHLMNWENQGMSVNYTLDIKQWQFFANIYQTNFSNSDSIYSAFSIQRMVNPINKTFGLNTNNKIFDRGGKISVQREFDQFTLKGGFEAIHHEVDFSVSNNNRVDLNRSAEAKEQTFFLNVKYEPIDDLVINVGSRVAHYNAINNGQWVISPQADVKYFLDGSFIIKASAGRYYQFVREINFENRFGQSKEYFVLAQNNIPIGYSNKFMTGLSFVNDHLSVDFELFYKDLEGVLEYGSSKIGFRSSDLGPNPVNDYRIFRGTGKVQGIDLGLNYERGGWSQSLAYTLSQATNQFPNIYNNEVFPSREDSRHQLQYSTRYEWKAFALFGTYVYGSGRPYTDLSKIFEETDRETTNANDVISRLPDYHRIDLGVDYTFKLKKMEASIGLSVFNLLDRENVKYVQYIYSLPSTTGVQNSKSEVLGTATNQLNRTFSFDLGIRF